MPHQGAPMLFGTDPLYSSSGNRKSAAHEGRHFSFDIKGMKRFRKGQFI